MTEPSKLSFTIYNDREKRETGLSKVMASVEKARDAFRATPEEMDGFLAKAEAEVAEERAERERLDAIEEANLEDAVNVIVQRMNALGIAGVSIRVRGRILDRDVELSIYAPL